MKVAISADHRGIDAQLRLEQALRQSSYDIVPVPTCQPGQKCDYPDMAYAVAKAVSEGRADRGILICGSGIGMAIAANKVAGVRAALCHDELTAELSRSHNDANVLCMSAELTNRMMFERLVRVWLDTDFEAGRHARRVNKIIAIEQGIDPATITE